MLFFNCILWRFHVANALTVLHQRCKYTCFVYPKVPCAETQSPEWVGGKSNHLPYMMYTTVYTKSDFLKFCYCFYNHFPKKNCLCAIESLVPPNMWFLSFLWEKHVTPELLPLKNILQKEMSGQLFELCACLCIVSSTEHVHLSE
jgi:hypothetical protein